VSGAPTHPGTAARDALVPVRDDEAVPDDLVHAIPPLPAQDLEQLRCALHPSMVDGVAHGLGPARQADAQ
jgi:hypothetical protein